MIKVGDYNIHTLPSAERFINEVITGQEYRRAFKDKVIIDVGANLGSFTLYAYDYADKIFAIEPSPVNFECLKKNIEENNLSRVEAFNLAIGGRNGKRALDGDDSVSGGWKLGGDAEDGVETLTLASFMEKNGIEYADVIKIDVEGLEDEIFKADDFPKVANKIGLIIGEAHAGTQISSILKEHGFMYELTTAGGFLARRQG